MLVSCPRWGDSSKWGDGDLWCRLFGGGKYYADIIDVVDTLVTVWNLQSPDSTIWTPSISTSGVATFISGGSGPVTATPVVPGPGNTVWTPTISNAGVITLTSGSDSGQNRAIFVDSNGTYWYWVIEGDNLAYLSTQRLVQQRVLVNRLSVRLSFSLGADFIIDSIRPIVRVGSQLPARFIVNTDFTTHQRISIRISYAGGADFVINRIHPLVNIKHQNPRA